MILLRINYHLYSVCVHTIICMYTVCKCVCTVSVCVHTHHRSLHVAGDFIDVQCSVSVQYVCAVCTVCVQFLCVYIQY